jgi:hypothetical protein
MTKMRGKRYKPTGKRTPKYEILLSEIDDPEFSQLMKMYKGLRNKLRKSKSKGQLRWKQLLQQGFVRASYSSCRGQGAKSWLLEALLTGMAVAVSSRRKIES